MPTDGGPAADDRREAVDIYRYRPRATLTTAGVLFALIAGLRWQAGGPADATALLFTVPIALLAVTLGARAGLLAGLLSVGLLALWVVQAGVRLTPVGWAARVAPLLLVGVLLGLMIDRLRRADAERHRLAIGAHRNREAIEINDTLVQGLVATKWSLEAGNNQQALSIAAETLELGHRLVSDLIRDADLARAWTGTVPTPRT